MLLLGLGRRSSFRASRAHEASASALRRATQLGASDIAIAPLVATPQDVIAQLGGLLRAASRRDAAGEGVADPETHDHHSHARAQSSGLLGLLERHRNRGRDRVADIAIIAKQPFRLDVEAFLDAVEHHLARLMEHEQIDIRHRKLGLGEQTIHGLGHGGDGEIEHFRPVHVQDFAVDVVDALIGGQGQVGRARAVGGKDERADLAGTRGIEQHGAPFYDQMIGYLDEFGPVANSKTTFPSHDRLMGDPNEIGLRVNAKITLPSRDAGPVNSLWEKRSGGLDQQRTIKVFSSIKAAAI